MLLLLVLPPPAAEAPEAVGVGREEGAAEEEEEEAEAAGGCIGAEEAEGVAACDAAAEAATGDEAPAGVVLAAALANACAIFSLREAGAGVGAVLKSNIGGGRAEAAAVEGARGVASRGERNEGGGGDWIECLNVTMSSSSSAAEVAAE